MDLDEKPLTQSKDLATIQKSSGPTEYFKRNICANAF
jgi:hypothetical protein